MKRGQDAPSLLVKLKARLVSKGDGRGEAESTVAAGTVTETVSVVEAAVAEALSAVLGVNVMPSSSRFFSSSYPGGTMVHRPLIIVGVRSSMTRASMGGSTAGAVI